MAGGESVVRQEGDKRLLVIDFKGLPFGSDIAVYPQAMKLVIERLSEVEADEVVLSEYYDRIYNEEQTTLLKDIAELIQKLEADAIWSPTHLGTTTDSKKISERHNLVIAILNSLKSDPFKAYLELLQEMKKEGAKVTNLTGTALDDEKTYLTTLQYIRKSLEETKLIQNTRKYLTQLGEIPTDRGIYHTIFEAAIKPAFIGSRIFFTGTEQLELIDQYEVLGSKVYIYKHPDKIEYLYFINPPEYTLAPEKYFLLEKTKEVVAGHRPQNIEFMDMHQARRYFNKIYVATIADLALRNSIQLTVEEKEELATIVARYTIGYGVLEILLSDRQLTDVYIDSPLGDKPVYLVHSKYGQCQTNVIFSDEEARAIVSRFRALSGRPFDEAHPILDFDLPDLQTRIAVIGKPLALDGTAFAFRLHKETPWTLAQFLDNKMLSSTAAGLLSFFVDAQASMLIVGSRGAGKTSLLQSMMLEIPQNLRIIAQEDSVTGDSEILAERNGRLEKTTVGQLVDSQITNYGCENVYGNEVLTINPEDIRVFSLSKENKLSLQLVSQFIRHKVYKPIYEVTLRTGRKIKVTSDHSLFTLGQQGVEPIKTSQVKEGTYLAVPRILPTNQIISTDQVNLLKPLKLPTGSYLVCDGYRSWAKANRKDLSEEAKRRGLSKGCVQNWVREGVLPLDVAKKYPELFDHTGVKFKLDRTSKPIPTSIHLTPEFLNYLGLWISDGCYDGKYGVIISAGEPEEIKVIDAVASQLGLAKSRQCTDKYSRILANTGLVWILKDVLGFRGNSFSKHVPSWIFGLSDNQIREFLKGVYSGDGYSGKYEVTLSLQSRQLIKDVRTLLLRLGAGTREHGPTKDGLMTLSISSLPMLEKFTSVGFLQDRKNFALSKSFERTCTHDTTDVVPISRTLLEDLASESRSFNKYDYLNRGFKLGRKKLQSLTTSLQIGSLQQVLKDLANSDIYWDEVTSVKLISDGSKPEFVYDFSVPSCENFVCENVIAHNTQELPIPQMKHLGFSIQRLKTRPPLGGLLETEVSAEDALRTALRLGDSVLVVGEVRSSIRGTEEVLVVEKGITKRIPIKDLETVNVKEYSVPSVGYDLKTSILPLTAFVKHPERNKLLEVTTKTGRKVTVTPDHSLFTATRDFKIAAIECKDLKPGSQVVIPSILPLGFNDIEELNVVELLPQMRVQGFEEYVRESISKVGWKKATEIGGVKSGDIYNYFRSHKTYLPISSFKHLMQETETEFDPHTLMVRNGTSNPIPGVIPVNEEFCRFLGYYVSEGYHTYERGEGGSVIITNSDPKIINDTVNLSKQLFLLEPKLRVVHGAGYSTQIQLRSSPLGALFSVLGCGRTCTEKRIPSIIYGLSKRKVAEFLKGLFSGDGSLTCSERSGNAIRYTSTSKKLVEDVAYLLLGFGIVSTIRYKPRANNKSNDQWNLTFKDREMVQTFLKEIGFVKEVTPLVIRKWSHTTSNTIYFEKEALEKHFTKLPRKYRHLKRFLRCSKNYLRKVAADPECIVSEELKIFASGEFFLDVVKEVKEIELETPEPVYDLSVSPTQNFIGGFGGILLHNTEARALFEAMRVGAVGNVVMGTIHGESAYSIWDRIVNDLQVPTTSFKATDFAIVAAPIRFRGSLKRQRRLIEITEVGKHWEHDPAAENGFIEWMRYDANKDELELMEDNLKNSEWIEKIKRMRGITFEEIWAEILLRGQGKQFLVDTKNKLKLPALLEAEYAVTANNKLMLFEEAARTLGKVDHKQVLDDWKKWVIGTLVPQVAQVRQ